ncbi:hypothetical protein AUP07_0690 [methanogenic archaeon mixed culture ISO4-G1]|nr:hypothetical protein AUP07_0690 [methanogenic archaeon mixed culture ISO4-G1]
MKNSSPDKLLELWKKTGCLDILSAISDHPKHSKTILMNYYDLVKDHDIFMYTMKESDDQEIISFLADRLDPNSEYNVHFFKKNISIPKVKNAICSKANINCKSGCACIIALKFKNKPSTYIAESDPNTEAGCWFLLQCLAVMDSKEITESINRSTADNRYGIIYLNHLIEHTEEYKTTAKNRLIETFSPNSLEDIRTLSETIDKTVDKKSLICLIKNCEKKQYGREMIGILVNKMPSLVEDIIQISDPNDKIGSDLLIEYLNESTKTTILNKIEREALLDNPYGMECLDYCTNHSFLEIEPIIERCNPNTEYGSEFLIRNYQNPTVIDKILRESDETNPFGNRCLQTLANTGNKPAAEIIRQYNSFMKQTGGLNSFKIPKLEPIKTTRKSQF